MAMSTVRTTTKLHETEPEVHENADRLDDFDLQQAALMAAARLRLAAATCEALDEFYA